MIIIDRVIEGLYVGNEAAARKKETLKQDGITHVLVVGNQLRQHFPGEFVYKALDINDSPDTNISAYFEDCYVFIEDCIQKCGRVFVHCHLGISRSSTIAIAYLMRKYRFDYESAYKRVKDAHIDTQPNAGFITQLRKYQEYLNIPARTQGASHSNSKRAKTKHKTHCKNCTIF